MIDKTKNYATIDKNELVNLGLSSIKNYFLINPADIKDDKVLIHLLQKAKLGMQFEREMNLSKRAGEMMSFRIMKLTTQNKKELIHHIKNKMPQYL
jgi:hypothetical protein